MSIVLSLMCLLLSGCQDRSQQRSVLASLDRTIAQSTRNNREQMEIELASLQDKMLDLCSREKAALWLPVARRSEQITLELSAYISRQQEALMGDREDAPTPKTLGDSLRKRVLSYRDDILALNEQINHAFASRFEGLNHSSAKYTEISEQLQLLQNADDVQLPVLLTQLQHTIMGIGTAVVAFCGEHVGCFIERFDTYSAIIGQSSSAILPGQSLEIFAGIGAFSKAAQPTITIDGKACVIGDDGVARYQFPAGRKPGKYKVLVRIEYMDENGVKRWINREAEYEVVGRE